MKKIILFLILFSSYLQINTMEPSNKKPKSEMNNDNLPTLCIDFRQLCVTEHDDTHDYLQWASRQADPRAQKEALYQLAHYYMLKRDLEQAQKYYQQALALYKGPKRKAMIRFHLGLLALRQENREQVKIHFYALANQNDRPELKSFAQHILHNCKRKSKEPERKKVKKHA